LRRGLQASVHSQFGVSRRGMNETAHSNFVGPDSTYCHRYGKMLLLGQR
jgi:hypothetical protein